MATIYANRPFLTDNYGIYTIPDGDLQTFRISTNANITFAQGNTLDNSSSGFNDANRETSGSITAFIRKGARWLSVLQRQAEVTDPNYNLSISALVAQFGIGNQLNPQIRVTINGVVFDSEDYDFGNINSPAIQTFTFKAMSMITQ